MSEPGWNPASETFPDHLEGSAYLADEAANPPAPAAGGPHIPLVDYGQAATLRTETAEAGVNALSTAADPSTSRAGVHALSSPTDPSTAEAGVHALSTPPTPPLQGGDSNLERS